jgi:hypothetical protein
MSLPAPFDASACAKDLRAHLVLCEEILQVVTRENQALRSPGGCKGLEGGPARQVFLKRLDESLGRIRAHRQVWQGLTAGERARYPEVAASLRANQELIMRAIILDRENEQALLRGGLLPARQVPPVQRQRPHYVAELYRRHASA